jgi:hypothetical protein
MGTGVFVLGSARSGTSLVTRVVNLLGVPTSDARELKPADEDNPSGYYESRSMTSFNRRLLLEVGGSPYSLAPRFPDDWATAPALDGLRGEAQALVRSALPEPPWVWKDPRTCLTLPFWIAVTGVRPIVVLAHRDPLEVADSLVRRDDAPIPVSLGAWERLNRAALVNASGLPTFVVRYDRLLATPRAVAGDLAAFLRSYELTLSDPGAEIDEFVDPALRRSRAAVESPYLPSTEQRALADILDGLDGPHDRLMIPALPAETSWVDGLLEAERQTGMLELHGARRKAEREAERAIARRRILGIEVRMQRGTPVHRALSWMRRISR